MLGGWVGGWVYVLQCDPQASQGGACHARGSVELTIPYTASGHPSLAPPLTGPPPLLTPPPPPRLT
jgi:hypothetical protein